ncbi:MAG: inositol monophosphatase [Acidobacteriales bacterium]|nr:inositol monophosphatase [Terriglobales bacterium]
MQLANAIAPIAREAGALLMEHFERGVKTEYKGTGEVDLVTAADRASEKLIVERVRQQWPTHDIIGEEGSRTEQGSEWRWYIDPLDGTTNFAHGYPVFCVSIGVERSGEMIAGVLYDPTRDELFRAERGSGAELNGAAIHASSRTRLAESLTGTGFPSKKRHANPNIFFYHQMTMRSHGVRRAGSAALDLANVACGRYDGFWEFHLNHWDTSAGSLLVQEAGGKITRFDGSRFQLSSEEVLASNGLIHDEMIALFADLFAGKNIDQPISPGEYRTH